MPGPAVALVVRASAKRLPTCALIGDMISDPLDDPHRSRCRDCGATVWRYPTATGQHQGETVLLDDADGGYVIRKGEAFRATTGAGYRVHHHHQAQDGYSPRIAAVNEKEFLWM